MSDRAAPLPDQPVALEEFAGFGAIFALPGWGTAKLARRALEESARISRDVLASLNPIGDQQGSRLENRVVGAINDADRYRSILPVAAPATQF